MSRVYTPSIPVGTALYHLRKAHHMSQVELANRSGVGRRTIQRLERSDHERPKNGTLTSLAHAFGMTFDQLKYELGLAPFGSKRPATAVSVQPGAALPSPYGPRVDRLALMFLNLSAAQQDYLESVALALHSQRHESVGWTKKQQAAPTKGLASLGKEERSGGTSSST